MNINDMTIGQFKELSKMFGGEKSVGVMSESVGEYVIVRTRNEGLNFGLLEAADETGVVLKDARRIWWHKPKEGSKKSWYEGVAQVGLSSDSKVSCTVDRKVIVEDYSLTHCSKDAVKSIKEHPSHEG